MAARDSTLRERLDGEWSGITALLVLGVGLLDLFANVLPGIPFWAVFAVGFAVIVPLVAILAGEEDDEEAENGWDWTGERDTGRDHEMADESTDASTADAIETLRDRYARGELTDEQFERKLDRLLETDTPENATEYRRRAERDAGSSSPDPESEPEPEDA